MSTSTVPVAKTTRFSFENEANAKAAARFVNDIVKGSAAKATNNSLTVNSASVSSLNEATELLLDLGGQHIKN